MGLHLAGLNLNFSGSGFMFTGVEDSEAGDDMKSEALAAIEKLLPGAEVEPLLPENSVYLVVTQGPLRMSLYLEGSVWAGSGRWRENLLEVHTLISERDPSLEQVIRMVLARIREGMQSNITYAEEQIERNKAAMDRLPSVQV